MINRVVLVGRLTKDPELKYTSSGLPVARFTVAVNRIHKNENGGKEADFINCIAWRNQAENLANYTRKGSLIGVDGRIQTGSYEGQDGKRVYTTDVVADSVQFLEPSRQNDGQQQPQQEPYQQPYSAPQQQLQGQPPSVQQYQQQPPQQSYQSPQPQWGQQQYTANQQNSYGQSQHDPFSRPPGTVEVSEDDLPF